MGKVIIKSDESEANKVDNNEDANFKTAEEIAILEAEEAKSKEDEKPDEDDGEEDKSDVISIDDVEYILDDTGNAVKEDGSVFKTKDELAELEGNETEDEVTEIEIDDVKYTINEEGAAVNDKGEIAFSKDELAEMEETPEDAINMEEVIKATAIEVYDNDGNPIKYDNNQEGIVKHTADVYNKGSHDAVAELYEAFPEVQSLIRHIQAGGDPNTFNQRSDYTKVKLNKENLEQLKNVIYQAQTSRGNRPDQIDKYFKALSAGDTDNDNVYEEAEAELKYLQDNDKAFYKEQDKVIADQEILNKQQTNDYWGVAVEDGKLKDLNKQDSIYNIIKSGKVKVGDDTYTIPKQIRVVDNGKPTMYTRDDFFNWLFMPVTVNVGGKPITTTREQISLQEEQANRTKSNDLLDSFKRFVHYDDTQFIKEQINKDKVNTIKRLKSKKPAGTHKVVKTNKPTGRVIFK